MKKKLLACDVDGTLIQYHQDISREDLEAIKLFRNKGHFFALCTGRTLPWTIPIIKDYALQMDALILCNGSTIYTIDPEDPLAISKVSSNIIPNKIGLEIIEYFYHKKHTTIYWDDGKNTFEINDRLLSKQTSIIQEEHSIHVDIIQALKMTSDFATIGISPLSASSEEAEEIKTMILTTWGKYINCYKNQYFVDIGPLDSSKGSGILLLQKHLNIDFDIYAVGDSFNDIPMFEIVSKSHAFLMKNGDPSLIKYANNQVKSVSECINMLLSERI